MIITEDKLSDVDMAVNMIIKICNKLDDSVAFESVRRVYLSMISSSLNRTPRNTKIFIPDSCKEFDKIVRKEVVLNKNKEPSTADFYHLYHDGELYGDISFFVRRQNGNLEVRVYKPYGGFNTGTTIYNGEFRNDCLMIKSLLRDAYFVLKSKYHKED